MSSIQKGQRFGMLRVNQIEKISRVTCVCDCGKGFIVHGNDLRSGVRTSCDGCKSSQTIGAAQIEKGELELLGKQIAAHLQKMRGYEAKAQEKAGIELRKADDHRNSVSQLLAEAKAKCDGGGFKAFQEKYCPDLGRSRIYELLSIGSGKKTLEESRAEKRKRVAKSRSKVSATSSSVADKPPKVQPAQCMPLPGRSPISSMVASAPSVLNESTSFPEVAATNELDRELKRFSKTFTPKFKAWIGTTPTADDLKAMHNTLCVVAGELLRLAADVRKAEAPAPRTEPTAEESAAARKAEHAADDGLDIPGFLLRGPVTGEAAT
jgi:hypothetical protein